VDHAPMRDTVGSRPAAAEATLGNAVVDLLVRHRGPVLSIYLALSVGGVVTVGAPDRPAILWWLVGFIVVTCAGAESGVRRFLIDWVPALVIAAGYDTVRAESADLLSRAIVRPQLRFDEFVFGGTAPTVTLQRWLNAGYGVHPWDYVVWLGYLSHFVVTLGVVALLYVTDRERFHKLAMLVVTVSVAGFVTYFIIPAVPPWLASRQGLLPHTTRIEYEVWAHLGLPSIAKIFNGSSKLANPVAALPSLHAAWPLMVLLFIWPTARRGRWVFLGYLVFMVAVLVYGAEHYVSDILLGFGYTLVVYWGWHRYWAHHDQERGTTLAPAS
jgi:hypothetical protein